jgi:hypothetical protein
MVGRCGAWAKLGLCTALLATTADAQPALPARVRRVILHVPGGPAYADPRLRFVFFTPQGTQALWKPTFGTQWIVWTDGSIWPRHPGPGQPASWIPANPAQATADERQRIAQQAAPVYSQLFQGNRDSVGIEVSHSGRSQDRFPPAQIRAVRFLVGTMLEMSQGRLTAASIFGHKDLERRPAYVRRTCQRAGCPVYVDSQGRAFAIRVDPPEGLFDALAAAGLPVPRKPGGDADLLRAEALGPREVPRQAPARRP